jgi:hypothetical protein
MIVVIQCAASKRRDAGRFRAQDGRRVFFVAQPEEAPQAHDFICARPDDPARKGVSWRDLVRQYNETPGANPFGVLPAFELYDNETYRALVKNFGIENTYILSAGWGLINAGFLTPAYDITFSPVAECYKRRRRNDSYRDFCMLPERSDAPMVFFGGKDYAPLFSKLTRFHPGPRTVFYNSAKRPDLPECSLQRFETSTRTNWHYECANAFLNGAITCATPQ